MEIGSGEVLKENTITIKGYSIIQLISLYTQSTVTKSTCLIVIT